jgi:rhomboid protease GluP
MAITWQFILLTEATLLFLVYRSYYVIKEYEESVQAGTTSSLFDMRKLSNYLIYGVVPAIMILMYLITIADDNNGIQDGRRLVKWGSLYFPLVLVDGEWWRLITYGFQHSGFMHLFSNLIAYLVCVFTLQKRHSCFQIFGIFMLSVFFSGVFVLIFSQYNTVGASGGVFGLYGAVLSLSIGNLLFGKRRSDGLILWSFVILIVLAINIVTSFRSDVSMSGHLSGLVSGAIVVWLFRFIYPIFDASYKRYLE